jgi:hypothetical protein
VFIFTAFNKYFVQRYELPSSVSRISKTFISNSNVCYVIVETNDKHFEVYSIDLNLDDPRVSKSYILRYDMKEVNEKAVTNFHVRGSPKLESLNKIVMIFILHDNMLLSWKEGEAAPICKSEKASNYCYVSEDEFYYMEEK